mgnify:CR=1 FL=1
MCVSLCFVLFERRVSWQVLKHERDDLEVELTSKRDVLTQIKHERDALRGENAARRQQRGLVSAEELLIDYEKRRRVRMP